MTACDPDFLSDDELLPGNVFIEASVGNVSCDY